MSPRLARAVDHRLREVSLFLCYVTEGPMTFSNAERQARWRDRQQVKIDHVEEDWGLFVKAAGVFLRELARQGRSGAATASPATVAILTAKLRRLIERWPSLPVDVKKQLAVAKDSHAMGADYLKEKRP
jgi:hypothetical protein